MVCCPQGTSSIGVSQDRVVEAACTSHPCRHRPLSHKVSFPPLYMHSQLRLSCSVHGMLDRPDSLTDTSAPPTHRAPRTRTALAAAVGTRHMAEASAWALSPAPPPDGLLWSQLGLRAWQVGLRQGLVRTGGCAGGRQL
jgi:hypothetical protein